MKLYHVAVHREDQWYIGRVLERSGVTTQGRTLDELVSMLRDAIEALWSEEDVQLELVLAPDAVTVARSRAARPRPERRAGIETVVIAGPGTLGSARSEPRQSWSGLRSEPRP